MNSNYKGKYFKMESNNCPSLICDRAVKRFCRMVKKEHDLAVESSQPVEHKDYSIKAGQKIQINLGVSPFTIYETQNIIYATLVVEFPI